MSIFSKVFSALPRQGPGSEADTLRALDAVRRGGSPLGDILDVGCGCGFQTMSLLQNTEAAVTALDLDSVLLAQLEQRAAAKGLASRLTTVAASMKEMPLEAASFDLIWSEGAVYIMGFENALASFRSLLRPGGRVAISEAAWLVDEPPREAVDWWETEGGTLAHDRVKRAQLADHGYRLLEAFTGSHAAWWDNYLDPMAARISALRGDHTQPEEVAVLDGLSAEIEIHRAYLGTYGYVFYVAEMM